MKGITPFLWFDGRAEEAARFYTSVFPNSRVKQVTRFGKTGPGPEGSVMTVSFELDGQELVALNGGPEFTFTEAVSFVVSCESQKEVDYYWEKLSEGGAKVQCGWLKDRFGLSWQVTPTLLLELLGSSDRKRTERVMQAMMAMDRLDIAKLKQAFEQP